jgi:hypothetical protein
MIVRRTWTCSRASFFCCSKKYCLQRLDRLTKSAKTAAVGLASFQAKRSWSTGFQSDAALLPHAGGPRLLHCGDRATQAVEAGAHDPAVPRRTVHRVQSWFDSAHGPGCRPVQSGAELFCSRKRSVNSGFRWARSATHWAPWPRRCTSECRSCDAHHLAEAPTQQLAGWRSRQAVDDVKFRGPFDAAQMQLAMRAHGGDQR